MENYGQLWSAYTGYHQNDGKVYSFIDQSTRGHNGNSISKYLCSHIRLSDIELEKWFLWMWVIEGICPGNGSLYKNSTAKHGCAVWYRLIYNWSPLCPQIHFQCRTGKWQTGNNRAQASHFLPGVTCALFPELGVGEE